MVRLALSVALALLVGLVGAAIVHIGAILLMPRVSEDNAWARLSALTEPFRPVVISEGGLARGPAGAGDAAAAFGFKDPAFIIAACRLSLGEGPVHLSADADAGAGFWSASIHTRSGDILYSINERLALDERFDLVVGTPPQFEAARLAGLIADEEQIPVVVQASELHLTLRALVDDQSKRPFVERFVRSLRCDPIALGDNASASGPGASAPNAG